MKKNEIFIEKSIKIHGDKYDYSLVEYDNCKKKVKIICKEHGIFEQTPDNHTNQKRGCPFCGGSIKSTKEEFIIKSNIKHEYKYDYSLVEYINNKTKVDIICKEHGIFKQNPSSHLNGNGCLICCIYKKKLTQEDFLNRSNEIHGNKYDYSDSIYDKYYNKVKIICKKHGIFEQTPASHLSGIGCPCRNESKGEKIVLDILQSNNIINIRQKKFEGCINKRQLLFDFYLPEYNTCIEFDGMQHYIMIEKFGGEERLEYIKNNDNIKNNFCKENDIKIIRIKYDDKNIKEKIINNL